MSRPVHVLFIDNRDSFTFNLVDAFATLGAAVDVFRNDTPASAVRAVARERHTDLIVLSPGPGRPEDAGCCVDLAATPDLEAALFGVCLGHQVIVHAAGGVVSRAETLVHGKRSLITHDGHPLFAGLPSPFPAGRYHSLAATDVPNTLAVIARQNEMVMAVAHRHRPWYGVQFHPESILTTMGLMLLRNVLQLAVTREAACIPA